MTFDDKDCYLFAPIPGMDILANDGSSFSKPYLDSAISYLRGISHIQKAPGFLTYPSNYDEDLVQKQRHEEFSLSEWILGAIAIDGKGYPRKALLIHSVHHEEGMLIALPSGLAEVYFYRGFAIKEFDDAPIQSGIDFLLSLGIEESEYEVTVSDDDEEEPIIEVSRPKFVPHSKKKIVNLGGYEAPVEVDVDEEGDLHIDVDRPQFVASSNKKPRNLGSSGFHPKRQIREEGDSGPGPISIERPQFEAASSKKPKNITFGERRKQNKPIEKKPPVTQPVAPKPLTETPAPEKSEPKKVEVDKPAFSANSSKKPRNLHIREENPTSVVYESIGGESLNPRRNREPRRETQPVVEERNWTSIDVFKLKPRVFSGERALVNSPSFHGEEHFSKASGILSSLNSIRISKNCVFVPGVFDEDDPHLSKISSFDFTDWEFLAITLDKQEDVIYNLLQNKKEDGFCILVSFKHKGPHIVMVSLKGAALDDRALPYLAYEQLKQMALGNR